MCTDEEQVLALRLDEEVPADLQLQRVPHVERAQVPLLEPHPHAVAETVVLARTSRSGHRVHLIDHILVLAVPGEPEDQEDALPFPLAVTPAGARIRVPLDDGPVGADALALEDDLQDLVPRHIVVGDADAQPRLRLGRVAVHRSPDGEVLDRLDTVVADDRRHAHADRDMRPSSTVAERSGYGLDVLLRLASREPRRRPPSHSAA